MLREVVEECLRGFHVGGYRVVGEEFGGRFSEEMNLRVYLELGGEHAPLLHVKVFYGRRPFYRAWTEFFGIRERLTIGGEMFLYFGSMVEWEILRLFSQGLGPGESIFVEYLGDMETEEVLRRGAPAPVSRLGYILFNLGFTWFKDWYFAEGFREGEVKLQGEKPLNREIKSRHLREIYRHARAFMERFSGLRREPAVSQALRKGKVIMRLLEETFGEVEV